MINFVRLCLDDLFDRCSQIHASFLLFFSSSFFHRAPTLESGGPKATSKLDFAIKHTAPGVGRMTDLCIVEGKGSFVKTDNNEVLLDFATGIGTVILGHSHPKVVSAVQEQAGKITHAQVNISFHDKQLELVSRLKDVMPKGLDRFFFWNGGADAVEASWKLARHATGKKNLIVFKGSYHGRTFATMGMTTSKTIYSLGFGPFVPGVYVTPFPYCLHCPSCPGQGQCCNDPLKELDLLMKQQTAPSDTAAIIIEPVLGEGGYVPPPKGFMPKLREFCTKHKILLIADEVQSGFGRTGHYFAVDKENVVPDILVFAKGIANGHVISGIASTHELMSKQPAGSMGGTYAGNVLSCAAAIATIDAIKEEKVIDNVRKMAPQFMARLQKMQKDYPKLIRDVRGDGLMIGVEFSADLNASFASEVSQLCLHQGMILLTTSVFPTVRFIPPLNISKAEMDLGLDIFENALKIASGNVEKHKAN